METVFVTRARKYLRPSVLLFGLAGVVAACADKIEQRDFVAPQPRMQESFVSNTIDPDRKDTQWAKMDDVALANEIRKWEGRVLIGFKDADASDGVDASGKVLASAQAIAAAKEMLRSRGVELTYEFKRIPAVAANMSADLVSEIRRNPYVDYLEPAAGGGLTSAPTLPAPATLSQSTPYGISNIGAIAAQSYTTGFGIKTIIIDSGIDIYHADLYSRIAFRCVNSAYPAVDNMGHGTHVAGIAAALNNTTDVIGVAPDLYLMSANVTISGLPIAAEVACAIDVARLNSVFAANMSLFLAASTAVTDEINGGYNYDNMIFVASVGNDTSATVRYPASLSNVIAVGAVDNTNTGAVFSNTGAKVELAAPGVLVESTAWTGAYYPNCASGTSTSYCDGTSMAAPHVTGAAVLVKAYNPTWTNAQVRSRLASTAYDLGLYGRDNVYGYGLVNLAAAIP